MQNSVFSASFSFASSQDHRSFWNFHLLFWQFVAVASADLIQVIQGLKLWTVSLVVVKVSSLSPREVLAFVEVHFLLPDSRARPDLKTKKEGARAKSRQVNTCWGPLGQRQWKVMESSLWSAQPDMNPRLQPLLLNKNI